MRHDDSPMGYGSNKRTDDDSRIGPNDLRVKLRQKEISRRAQLEVAERKKRELYEKVSRAIQSAEQEGVRQRKTTLSRIVDEPCQMDTKRSTYASPMLNGERTRSPDRVVRYSDGISNHMNLIDERPPQVAPLMELHYLCYCIFVSLFIPQYLVSYWEEYQCYSWTSRDW